MAGQRGGRFFALRPHLKAFAIHHRHNRPLLNIANFHFKCLSAKANLQKRETQMNPLNETLAADPVTGIATGGFGPEHGWG